MTTGPARVLFVSTSDAARAIMAEAVLRSIGGDRFEGRSAGTHPGQVHPLTAQALDAAGLDRSGLRSKGFEEVRDERFDYVITLCDDARAICPVFPGADQSIHWGYANPASASGSDQERQAAFERVLTQISERVRQFVLVAGRASRERAGATR